MTAQLEDPFLPPYDGSRYAGERFTVKSPADFKGDLVERRILLGESKIALQEELDEINKKLAEIDGQIIQEWQESETQNVKRLGHTLSFVRTKYAVGTGDKETLIRTLQQLGAQHCVGVIHQSLTAYVREQEQQGGLPSALVDQVELRDRYSLRMKKG